MTEDELRELATKVASDVMADVAGLIRHHAFVALKAAHAAGIGKAPKAGFWWLCKETGLQCDKAECFSGTFCAKTNTRNVPPLAVERSIPTSGPAAPSSAPGVTCPAGGEPRAQGCQSSTSCIARRAYREIVGDMPWFEPYATQAGFARFGQKTETSAPPASKPPSPALRHCTYDGTECGSPDCKVGCVNWSD